MEVGEVVHFLKMALYDGDHELEESARLEVQYRRFVLCPGLSEVFDGDWVFVMECADQVRLIGQAWENPNLQEVLLPATDFYGTLASFGQWANAILAPTDAV